MKTKTVVIVAGAAVALYLVYQHKSEKEQEGGDFGKGYAAGWVTPGPFTIMAIAGWAHVSL